VLDIVRDALRKPAASAFKEQKRLLKDVVDSLEQSLRIRIRSDLEKTRTPEDAVTVAVNAIPGHAKTRAMARDELLDLGAVAGLDAVLQAMNWGDYEILLNKFYDEIEWKGAEQAKEDRLKTISQTFKNGHVVRHNNDHETKQMIDKLGYDNVYQQFSSLREMLSG
jgi:predicted metal-dependent RNase